MNSDGRIVYLDNAATSWPKPPAVGEAMAAFLRDSGGNPGRSGHRLSIAAGRVVSDARDAVASVLGLADPLRVAFMANATMALNTALFGFLKPGDRVVADSMAHNAVARPLAELIRRGVSVDWARADSAGRIDLEHLEALARGVVAGSGSPTKKPARMLVITHGSNVCGSLAPLAELAGIAARTGAVLLVDAAQTAGVEEIHLDRLGQAVLAFTGHKAMLGPGGTGGLAFGATVDIDLFSPFVRGGTGSASESEDHPMFLPDRFEAGTANAPGLAGLCSGLQWIEERGRAVIHATELQATEKLAGGLRAMPGATVYGPATGEPRCAVLSFNLAGWSVSQLALELDERYGILCRVGLHCAPRAHRSLGTFPDGTARLAPGPFTTPDDIEYTLDSIRKLAAGRAGSSAGSGREAR
jgi:cysteine desulfurase family protein